MGRTRKAQGLTVVIKLHKQWKLWVPQKFEAAFVKYLKNVPLVRSIKHNATHCNRQTCVYVDT